MTGLQRRSPGSGELRGAPGTSPGRQIFLDQNAIALERLQFRLSAHNLALHAVLPDIAFLEQAVQLTAMGMPLPAGGQVRLHRLALKLFDLRVVLEHPEVHG